MSKITGYSALGSPAAGDLLVVVDVDDTSMAATGTDKKITVANLLGLQSVYVDQYGADPTGATDSTTAIVAAQAALGTAAGNLVFGAGTYVWGTSSNISSLRQNQGITGQGATVTAFTYKGSATAIPVALVGGFTGGQLAGKFTGFTLDGYSAGGAAIGFQQGNLQRCFMDDVTIQGFGGSGINLVNAANQWAEQATYRVTLIQNTIGMLLDTGSFDYSNYDLMIVANASQTGLQLQNGANIQGGNLRIRGNFAGGVTNTGSVIAVAPAGGADTAFVKGTVVDIGVETTGSSTGHHTLLMGSTTSASQWFTQGTMFFANVGITFQGYSNAHNVPFSHNGILSDQVLGNLVNGYGGVIYGGLQQNVIGTLATALFSTQLFVEASDIVAFQLVNGAQTLTFQSVGTYGQRMDLYIAQPASGAAGTITWPANVKWASATAPALSTVNSRVDHIRLTYLPAQGNWYGELIGTNYA